MQYHNCTLAKNRVVAAERHKSGSGAIVFATTPAGTTPRHLDTRPLPRWPLSPCDTTTELQDECSTSAQVSLSRRTPKGAPRTPSASHLPRAHLLPRTPRGANPPQQPRSPQRPRSTALQQLTLRSRASSRPSTPRLPTRSALPHVLPVNFPFSSRRCRGPGISVGINGKKRRTLGAQRRRLPPPTDTAVVHAYRRGRRLRDRLQSPRPARPRTPRAVQVRVASAQRVRVSPSIVVRGWGVRTCGGGGHMAAP